MAILNKSQTMEKDLSIFDETYRDYLAEIGKLDLRSAAEKLGAVWREDNSLIVPLFGEQHSISSTGIKDSSGKEPSFGVKVLLCRYALGSKQLSSSLDRREWVSYKDFKESAPLVGAFRNNAELSVAKSFSGRIEDLRKACTELGGYPADGPMSYDLSMVFPALPRIAMLLVFNDADEEFSAECRQLFEARAEKYLDAESLAILGWLLADYLIKRSPGTKG